MSYGRTMPKPTALGVHVYAGGFSLGIRKGGFDVVAHLESGDYGLATMRRNQRRVPVHIDPRTWPVAELAGGIDLVYGNPPQIEVDDANPCSERSSSAAVTALEPTHGGLATGRKGAIG